jgi:orotate phosphoribosyltransferase-like protein
MREKKNRNQKILALSKAGWSTYKISRHFRVSPPRITYILHREKAKYRKLMKKPGDIPVNQLLA